MMKKRVMSMLMVMIMMVSMLSVSVFAVEEHTCVAADTWTTESGKHWKVCTVAECTAKLGEDSCADADSNGKCDVCDADVTPPAPVHEHSWATTWTKNDTHHWHECSAEGCDVTENSAKNGYQEHSFTVDTTNSNSAVTKYVCVCGATKEETHTHTYETAWTTDNDNHWYKATCGHNVVSGKEAHSDANNDNICDVCSFKKIISTLAITDLNKPVEGAAVDFSVTVSPAYGTAKVYWNRSASTTSGATAVNEGATFAADYMYSVGILITPASGFVVSDALSITLNGTAVTFYASESAANEAIKTYNGTKDVGVAYVNAKGQIMVGMMYTEIPGDHKCVWATGDNWTESTTQHWHACAGCGQGVKDAGAHYDKNASGLCDVCGYDMKKAKPVHTHAYSTDWVEDISNHWKQCTGCGAKTQKAAHADLNNTGKCDVCGFVMTAAAGHTHTFSADWTETFAQHYKVCGCGAKNEIAAHADLNNTGKCDVCGYAMTTLSNNGIVADTGDDNATFMWMAAFVVAVLGFGATVIVARKKREE